MGILNVILLAIIAYILWRIYRQRENEKVEIANEKNQTEFGRIYRQREDEKAEFAREEFQAEREQEKNELAAKYPHLVNKLEGNWLRVFATNVENGVPLLKAAFLLMLGESVKIEYSEGSMKWDILWYSTEELLEHLEKYHEGSITEHEIAVCTYWQIAATEIGKLIEESPEKEMRNGRAHAPIEGKKLETEPFTNITKIASLFPKKVDHPAQEISFSDEKGFPRESKSSPYIREKMKALGL